MSGPTPFQVRMVEGAVRRLEWDVNVAIDTDDGTVIVMVPEASIDEVAETTVDFFRILSKSMSAKEFVALDVVFIVDDNAEGEGDG